MRSDSLETTNYNFTSPYPKPQFEYPSAHSRSSLPQNGTRSPSPTPSEIEEANQPFIPRKLFSLEFYKRPKVILWIIIFIIIGVFSILITIYHKQIEDWLRPAADWMKRLKFGFLIPIAVLFIISFPPLFGHEIVAVLCGNVWGLWEGFGIVCAGTLLGEIGNFYAFKYLCTARGEKLEKESFFYGCLARSVRDGGFLVAVMARLSVIPGHFTTAVFATCGMNIIIFVLAAILSLPKQFVTVYLGVLLEQSSDGPPTRHQRLISDLVVVASVVITSAAMWYIIRKMKKYRLPVVRDRRKRLAGGAGMKPYRDEEGRVPLTAGRHHPSASTSSLVSNDVFNPGISDAELAGQPMQVGYDNRYGYRYTGRGEPVAPTPQRWDERGKAVDMQDEGYSEGYDDPYAYNSYPPPRHTPLSNSPMALGQTQQPIAYEPPSSPPPHLRPQPNPFTGAVPSQQQQSPRQPQRTFSPPAGPPPGAIYQPDFSKSAPPAAAAVPIPPPPVPAPAPAPASVSTSAPTSYPPPYTTAPPAPPSITVGHHDSPHTNPQSPFDNVHTIQIPAHVKRYQLSDGGDSFRSTQTLDKDADTEEEPTPKRTGGHSQEISDSSFYSAHSRVGTSDVDLR